MPMVDALEDEWARCPPVHRTVAAFMGYRAPEADEPAAPHDGPEAADDCPPPWMQGMGVIPGPEAARTATTAAEAMAAFERQFFGEVKDAPKL